MCLKKKPKTSSLVNGNKIKRPRISVINPGIKRKKPPMGVKRFLRIVSGVKSNSCFDFILIKVFIP